MSQLKKTSPTPTVSSMVQNGSSSDIDFDARRVEREVDPQGIGEEMVHLAEPIAKRGGLAHGNSPKSNLSCAVGINGGVGDDERDRDETTTAVRIKKDEDVPLARTSGDDPVLQHHHRDPGLSRAVPGPASMPPSYQQSWNQDQEPLIGTRDPVHGGFPFPARTCALASTMAPSPAMSRNAKVVNIGDVSCRSGSSDDAGTVATSVSGRGSGWSAIPSLPRAMLAIRAAVGRELYAVGERLLRCVEADHREVHGKLYRAIPITRAEREQFHVCLEDASHGSLRRAVLAYLKVQESYRAIAAERDRGDAVKSRGGRSGGGGGGVDGFPAASRKKRGKWDAGDRPNEVSSLKTGPLSSPAEKARAAR